MTPSRSWKVMPSSRISQSVIDSEMTPSSPFSTRTIRQRVAHGQK